MPIAETIGDAFGGRFVEKGLQKLGDINGQRKDIQLGIEIHEWLQNTYGDELFYNDFDAFLSSNHTVENLIVQLRDPAPQQAQGREEFAKKATSSFVERYQKQQAHKGQIEDIFTHIFDRAYSGIFEFAPYSETGTLFSALQVGKADDSALIRDMHTMIKEMYGSRNVAQLPITSEPAEQDFTGIAKEFQAEIEQIVSELQSKNRFQDALDRYMDLSLRIADTDIRGEARNKLLCNLRCNIALCHSNLNDLQAALKALEVVPAAIAESDATYNYVKAAILVQHHCSERYADALNYTEVALRLKPDHHRAFFLYQQLRALLNKDTKQNILNEIETHFAKISDPTVKDALTDNYYAFRGLVCIAFDDPDGVYENYTLAKEHGYDELIAQFNMLCALYGQAVRKAPRGQRLLHPELDYKKLYDVWEGLKSLLQNKRLEEKSFQDLKYQAVRLYAGTSCALMGTHDLKPVDSYLPLFTEDYETTRLLIMGSEECLTSEITDHLHEDDRFVLHVRQLLHEQGPGTCKAEIEAYLACHGQVVEPSVVDTLLQLCIMTEDVESYRTYRELGNDGAFAGGVLDALDACACEIEGNVEKAKAMFDAVAQAHTDYPILENTFRFYKRNGYITEGEAVLFKLQSLQSEKKIYIKDIDTFCREGIHFLVSNKRPSAEDFLKNADIPEISPETYTSMKAFVYNATNDAARLHDVLPYPDHTEFQNGFDRAICLRLMLRYDEGLQLSLELAERPQGIDKEEFVKLYWLISDFYLLKKDMKESYEWAVKAHELMKDRPHDQSHQAWLGRAMRCGHFEALKPVIEYQQAYPAAVDYIKTFSVSPEEEDVGAKLLRELEKAAPNASTYGEREREFAKNYRELPAFIHLVIQHYDGNWLSVLEFARKNKLRLGNGNTERRKAEELWLGEDIVVDAETLAIMAFCKCLSALELIKRIHISYGSISVLQKMYLSNTDGCTALNELMDWINMNESIILEADGINNPNEILTKALPPDFFAGCNVATRLDVPFLCADALMPLLQEAEVPLISEDIRFITIPSLCNAFRRSKPGAADKMLYELLKVGAFISFSADTILEQVRGCGYKVEQEVLQPFLICKSEYDMGSFARVYLEAITKLKTEHEQAAVELSQLILHDAERIWRRGTYYRESALRFEDERAEFRANHIAYYISEIAKGIKRIWKETIPALKETCDSLWREKVAWLKEREAIG